jgi:hypothetical protein
MFDLKSLKNQFTVKKTTTSLGHASKRGTETVAKMAQIGLMETELEGVSEQIARLDFDKGFAKHRAAYVKGLGFCVAVPNELTNKTMTITMPLPMKKVEDFKTSVDKFPTSIMNKGTKNMYPDFEFIKHDESGNVVSKAIEDNGNWSLAKYNMPVYKQRVNQYGEPIAEQTNRGEERIGVLKDEEGIYLETSSKYAHCALASVTIVPGFQISASGTKVQGTDGLYLITGDNDDKAFQKANAGTSAAKFSIKSLVKLITHPSFGIANSSDLTTTGTLKQGSCRIDTKPSTINVYNSDSVVDKEFSKVISDRPAFRLTTFRAKGVRASSLEASLLENSKATKESVAKTITGIEDLI